MLTYPSSLEHPSASAHFASASPPGMATSEYTRVRSGPPTLSWAFRHPLHTLANTNRQLPSRLRFTISSRMSFSGQHRTPLRNAAHPASVRATTFPATVSSTSAGRPPAPPPPCPRPLFPPGPRRAAAPRLVVLATPLH